MNMPAPNHSGGVTTSAAESDPGRSDNNLDDDIANGDDDDGRPSISIVRRFAILHVDLVCESESASIEERSRHILYYFSSETGGRRRRRPTTSTSFEHRGSGGNDDGVGVGEACENGYGRDDDGYAAATAEDGLLGASSTKDADCDDGDGDGDGGGRPPLSKLEESTMMKRDVEEMEEAVRFSGFCLGLSGLADACKSTDGFRHQGRRRRGRDAATSTSTSDDDDDGNGNGAPPPRKAGPGPPPTMEGVVHLSDSTLVFVRLEEDLYGDGRDDGDGGSSSKSKSSSSSTTPLLAVAQFTRPPAFPPASSSRGRRGSSSSSSSASSSSSRGTRGRSHSHGHHGSRRRGGRKGRRKWWRSRSSSTGGSGSGSGGGGGRSSSSGRSGSGSGVGGRGAAVVPPGADASAVRAAIERSHLLFRIFHGGGIRRRLLPLRRPSVGGNDGEGVAAEEDDVVWTSLRDDLRFHYDSFLEDMATSVSADGGVGVGVGRRRSSSGRGGNAATTATPCNYRSVLELVPPPPDAPVVRRGDLSESMGYHNHNRDHPRHHHRRPRGGRWSPAGVVMSPNHRQNSRTPPHSQSPSPLLPPSPSPSPCLSPPPPSDPQHSDPIPPPLRAGLALGKIATEWMVEALSGWGWWCGPVRDGGGCATPTATSTDTAGAGGPPVSPPLLLGVSLFHRGQLLWSQSAVATASTRDPPPPTIDVPTGYVASVIHSHMRSRSSSSTSSSTRESPVGGNTSPQNPKYSSISPPAPQPPPPQTSVAEELLLASTSPSKFRGRAVVDTVDTVTAASASTSAGGLNNGGSSSMMIANEGGVGVCALPVGRGGGGGGGGGGGEGGWAPAYLAPPSLRPRRRGGRRMVVDVDADAVMVPSFGEVWMPRVYLPNNKDRDDRRRSGGAVDAPSESDGEGDRRDRDCDVRAVLLDAGNDFTALLYLDGGCLGDVDADATTTSASHHATTVDTDPTIFVVGGASSSSPATIDYSKAPPPPPPPSSRPVVSELLTSAAEALESALAPLVVDGAVDTPSSSSYFHLSLPDAHDEPGLHVIYVDRGDDAGATAACRSAMTGNRHGLDPRGELARRMPPDVATALDDAIAEMRGAGAVAGDHDDDDDDSSSVSSSSAVVTTREVCTSLPHSWVFGRSLASRDGSGGVRRREIYMLLDANRFVTIADVEGALRRARADLHWAV